jgi:hypothetical protein
MRNALGAAAALLFVASPLALATQPNVAAPAGVTTSTVSVIGGGSTSVLQEGVGTSSATFTTLTRTKTEGDVGSLSAGFPSTAGVVTGATTNGRVVSRTEGMVTGNAAGANFSQGTAESHFATDAAARYRAGGGNRADVDASSSAFGGASAGSRVELGPNDPGVTTSGVSRQTAEYLAGNVSGALAHARTPEYGRVSNEAQLYTGSVGGTLTTANGRLRGEGGTGFSNSFAGQAGTASGTLQSRDRGDSQINMTASTGTNFELDGKDVSSFSMSSQDGEGAAAANSFSVTGTAQTAKVKTDGTVRTVSKDLKFTQGTVVSGEGTAGGGVTVDFDTTVEVDDSVVNLPRRR